MRRWLTWRRVVAGAYALGLAIAAVPLALQSMGEIPIPSTSSHARPAPSPSPTPTAPPSSGPLPGGPSDPSRAGPPAGSGAGYRRVAYTTPSDIPRVALDAYRTAAMLISRTDPTCHLRWSLLAAIGRVESGNGTYGGATIGPNGDVSPSILGPVLDGSGDTALVTDTDHGRLDGNTRYDRAVGPMQFLPSTWRVIGVDGNGDGGANPENVFDAALSAGRYLCAGDADLSYASQLRAAVYRYNHSESYVSLVLRLAAEYASGHMPSAPPRIPSGVHAPPPFHGHLPPATTGRPLSTPPAHKTAHHHRRSTTHSPTPSGSSSPHTSGPGRTGGGSTPSGHTSPPNTPPGPPSGPSTPPSGPSSPGPTTPPAPVVGAFFPDKGAVGTTVTIQGTGLNDATATFDGQPAKTVSSSARKLVVAAPQHAEAGPATVGVHGSGGNATASQRFVYVPSVSAIHPQQGPVAGGTKVTISGTSLKGVDVQFGGKSFRPSSPTGTALEVTSPAVDEAGPVDITLTKGEWKTTEKFTYYAISLDPPAVLVGKDNHTVTITAEYTTFPEGSTVTLDGSALKKAQRKSGTEIAVTLPGRDTAALATVTVDRPELGPISTDFAYLPVVSKVSPNPVKPGQPVKVTGKGFVKGSNKITLTRKGSTDAVTVCDGNCAAESGDLTFTVPSGTAAGTYLLIVTTAGASSDPFDLEVTS